MMALEFASIEELIDELTKRSVFHGMVIYIKGGAKDVSQMNAADIGLRIRGFSPENIVQLLELLADHFRDFPGEGFTGPFANDPDIH